MPHPPTGTVTFLFTDIEGSTQLWEHHALAMTPALERHDALVRAIVEGHGGYIFKVAGDAFRAAFETAAAAIVAAIEIQRAVAGEDWAAFGLGFPPLRIRMALHTGETREHGQDYFGAPVNRVARLESAANGGQILMTAATERIVREQLPAGAAIRDLGEHRLKDLRYAEHIFQLLAPGLPDATGELRTGGAVRVENPAALDLPPGAATILARLFHAAGRLVIESELAGGFSGSRVFKVTPFDADDQPEPAAVVKLAPAGLVTREYEAYQTRIRGKLSGIPEIWGRPAYAEGGRWAGIRYALVGGQRFDIQSLRRYWGRAELADLVHVLESRPFVHLGAMWHHAEPRSLRLADSYDRLLPVNLVVRPETEPLHFSAAGDEAGGTLGAAAGAPRIALSPETLGSASPQVGDRVTLTGFVVESIAADADEVTLNLPTAAAPGGRACRLRVEPMPGAARWRVGDLLNGPIAGEVTATRASRLAGELREALGHTVDLDAEAFTLEDDADAPLPNPLLALPRLLGAEHRVRVGAVHGDLNLENVLVDAEARSVQLIDFALSRDDHVLHDLLRLETGVLTRLLPDALAAAGLPPDHAAGLLAGLHRAPDHGPVAPPLRPMHVGLVAIRRAAATLLARPGDWLEYHLGLAAYLLGACKFGNLAPEAKQVAFWASARATGLALEAPAGGAETLSGAMAILLQRVPALEAYRRGRIAEWSGPRFELDDRFVGLELLIDLGEEAVQGRWQSQEARYPSLETLLADVEDPALVLLGAPGSGKSTLLRHLELSTAMEGLRGADQPLTFFIQLNQYPPARAGDPPPDPGAWLNARWRARYPDLPALDELLAEGRVLLLLDALNEMPAESLTGFLERVALWRDWLLRLTRERPGNRVVFSCRSLDYSQPLSTPALRVPQVRIEPMDDAAVQAFLRAYIPDRFELVWDRLAGTRQLDVVRSPFFLKLLVDQVDATGELPTGRSGLFTGFVRQALGREIGRGNPLFKPGELLTRRDRQQVTGWNWQRAYDLPERGLLLPKLAELAWAMQAGREDGEVSQVRIDRDQALALLRSDAGEAIVAAGQALAVLDQDRATHALMYFHQLLQEYFAARELARQPNPELVRVEWRAARVRPSVDAVIDGLDSADPLPPLPSTGWEETTALAAAMAEDPARFLSGIMASNLALAGQAAAQPELLRVLPASMRDTLRWSLVHRSRDPEADLRDRIACGFALGDLGDPRFERRVGPHGAYLLPPLVEIPAGRFHIGSDEVIDGGVLATRESIPRQAHLGRHAVDLPAFRIGCFPVTRAEWACFLEAGGYADERWWTTPDARRWLRAELPNFGAMQNNRLWRNRFLDDPTLLDRFEADGTLPAFAVKEFRHLLTLDDDAFEQALLERWRGKQYFRPGYWVEERFAHPLQPVVGLSWFEARAYCAWLSAQSGIAFRLPSEVEWEAAGLQSDETPGGSSSRSEIGNFHDLQIRRPTPIGLFPAGDSRFGVADLLGNVEEWTRSLFGPDPERPSHAYPYDAGDGREDPLAAADMHRVCRGGAWTDSLGPSRSGSPYLVVRNAAMPSDRRMSRGMRLAVGA